jgi:S-(hydroxymethyl)glutathione dehydrogenase / alcohol dehydrogenase
VAVDVIEGVRAAVWDGAELVVDDVSLRPPASGEVTVRVLASGICHSDLNVMDGLAPVPAPVVLGHEAAGVVDRVGDGVEGLAVGDEVMVSSMTPCGDCPSCRAGRPSRCPATYGRPSFPFRWRGRDVRAYANVSSFASHVTVRASQAVKASGLPPAVSALVGCAVSTGWGAVRNVAQVAAGETVVVVGVGGIGVNAIAAARAAGAGRIVAVDVDPRKEAAARHFGADEFVTEASAVAGAEVIDVVIECSGAPAAISAAVTLAPTVALVGIPPAGVELSVDARSLVLGRRLLGSLNGDIVPERHLPAILDQVRAGTLDVAAQVGGVWPLDRIHDAIAAVRAGDVIRATLDLR